jgi:ribosome biogenesis protein BMS1
MKEKASVSYIKRSVEKLNLMETVYGANWAMASSSKGSGSWNKDSDEDDDDGSVEDDDDNDDFFTLKNSPSIRNEYKENNAVDSNRIGASSRTSFTSQFEQLNERYTRCQQEANKKGAVRQLFIDLKEKFVTGSWGKKGSMPTDDDDDVDRANEYDDDNNDDAYGDFEDLQTGEKFSGNKQYQDNDTENENDNDENDNDDDDNDDDDESSVDSQDIERMNQDIDDQLRQQNAKSKAEKKARFDLDYDEEQTGEIENEDEDEKKYLEMLKRRAEEQSERNKKEFGEDGEQARLRYEGFRQGIYVRVVLSGVPKEFMQNFRPHLPCILGGLLPHESALGYVRARVKRHRWHKRILKSNDPLIFSVGWRRFQTMPIYTMSDIDERQRFVKYTPEHMHCDCIYYGPLIPPNTGILAFQRSDSKVAGFRISLTGTSLELKSSPNAVKKLKLTGTPVKVFKNTAFITGMFNSALEVAKFEGAKIKTVSGIRGQVKKPLRDGEPGKFRATFEDKILVSDIVICRLWVPVEIKKFYNPVLTFLTSEDPEAWQGMRSVSQIRKDEQVPIPIQKDSLYAPITRVDRKFKKLVIPTKLQAALPFASKPKQQSRDKGKSYIKRRAVVLDPEDRKKRALLSSVGAIANEKQKVRSAAKAKSLEKRDKAAQQVIEKFADVHKEEKKRKFRNEGRDQSQKRNRN